MTTIYDALAESLGRKPTHEETKAEVRRILSAAWAPGNVLDRAIYAVQREFKDTISRVRAEEILRERLVQS